MWDDDFSSLQRRSKLCGCWMPRYVSYISKDRYTFAVIEQFQDDCRWAPWGDWSSCANTCGNRDAAGLTGEGEQTRTREIATEAVNDGTPCNQTETCTVSVPAEVFSLKCEAQSCKKECQGKCLCWAVVSRPSHVCFQARNTIHSINMNIRNWEKKVWIHSNGGEAHKSSYLLANAVLCFTPDIHSNQSGAAVVHWKMAFSSKFSTPTPSIDENNF